MQAQVKLGRVFGIRIGLHYSWFIIAFLIVFSLAEQLAAVHREWRSGVVWGTAIVTAVFFFVCIVLHELGHSVVAQSRGIRVPSHRVVRPGRRLADGTGELRRQG